MRHGVNSAIPLNLEPLPDVVSVEKCSENPVAQTPSINVAGHRPTIEETSRARINAPDATASPCRSGRRRRKFMRQCIRGIITLALIVSVVSAPLLAQAPPAKPPVPIKILVVISHYEGDKKVSNLPYTIAVTANERGGSLRMGSKIPVPSQGGAGANGGFTYQDIGTNIDCSATSLDENRFKVDVSISDSSVMERRSSDGGIPTLRSLFTNNSVVLKDGQSAQFTAAADKMTGEVVKVDVTLSIDK